MKKRYFFQILFGAVLMALSYPPFNLYPLIIIGIAIVFWRVINAKGIKEVFVDAYFTFFFLQLLDLSWISLSGVRENADRFLIIGGVFVILIYPLYFVLPTLFFYFVYKSSGRKKWVYFTFPFIWIIFEYCQTQTEISFPWLLVGNAFTTALKKIQFIEFTGVFGISLWAVFLSVLLCMVYESLSDIVRELSKSKLWKLRLLLLLLVIIYILPNLYIYRGTWLTDRYKVSVAVIQPNINPWEKWTGKQPVLINTYLNYIRTVVKEHTSLDLIVMPETALPFYFSDVYYEEYYWQFKNLIDSINVPLLIGSPEYVEYSDITKIRKDSKKLKNHGTYYDTFNSAILIEPGKLKENYQRYNKIKLVIGSERMPYQEHFPFLKDLIRWSIGIGSFQTGIDTTVFKLPLNNQATNILFNVAICYESIYPDFFSRFIEKGAEFSVVITNDGWWGKLFGTYQHNQYAVLRAIENRRYIIRCANTGISCIISPEGIISSKTDINKEAIFVSEVYPLTEKTFFTTHKNWLISISIVFIVLFIAFVGLLRISTRRNQTV
ncbi:MAG: apolipoprotein N-acyltransferase [Ignavibacteria bacterium]